MAGRTANSFALLGAGDEGEADPHSRAAKKKRSKKKSSDDLEEAALVAKPAVAPPSPGGAGPPSPAGNKPWATVDSRLKQRAPASGSGVWSAVSLADAASTFEAEAAAAGPEGRLRLWADWMKQARPTRLCAALLGASRR